MPTKPVTSAKTPADIWRNSAELKGVRARLVGAINAAGDVHVTISIRSARTLVEICDQAIHTEEGHGV